MAGVSKAGSPGMPRSEWLATAVGCWLRAVGPPASPRKDLATPAAGPSTAPTSRLLPPPRTLTTTLTPRALPGAGPLTSGPPSVADLAPLMALMMSSIIGVGAPAGWALPSKAGLPPERLCPRDSAAELRPPRAPDPPSTAPAAGLSGGTCAVVQPRPPVPKVACNTASTEGPLGNSTGRDRSEDRAALAPRANLALPTTSSADRCVWGGAGLPCPEAT